MKHLATLHTIQEWNEFTQTLSSSLVGLIIFKFSPRCPISRSVERGFNAWYERLPEDVKLPCVKIDVVNSRSLSQHIAQEFQIRHDSPQAIWLTPEQTVYWHASHYSITSDALDAQLQKCQI